MTPQSQEKHAFIRFSKDFPLKGTQVFRENGWLRVWGREVLVGLKCLILCESKEVLHGDITKGHRDQLEGDPTCQIQDNLSIRKNSDGNELWHRDFLKRIHGVCGDSQ